MQGNQTGRHTFIMLAGAYLLYLSWQLLSGFKNGEAKSPVFILAAVLFAVAGVVIIVTNVKAIIKLSREAQNAPVEESTDAETSGENTATELGTSAEAVETTVEESTDASASESETTDTASGN